MPIESFNIGIDVVIVTTVTPGLIRYSDAQGAAVLPGGCGTGTGGVGQALSEPNSTGKRFKVSPAVNGCVRLNRAGFSSDDIAKHAGTSNAAVKMLMTDTERKIRVIMGPGPST